MGKRVRAFRLSRGWTQAELGDLAGGMDEKYVGVVERGEQNITVETVRKISDALGVPMRALFDFDARVAKTKRASEATKIAATLSRLRPSERRVLALVFEAAVRGVRA